MRTALWLGLVVAGAAGAIYLTSRFAGGPEIGEPPLPPDLARLDPATGRSVREAHARVVRAPRDAAAWGELGMVYEANDLLVPAGPCYAQASRLAPSDVRWPYRGARVMAKTGRVPDAIAEMERAAAIDPRVAPARWQLGLLRLDAGDLAGAEADFLRATEAEPRDPSGWIGLARVHLQREQAPAAIDALQRALALRDDPYAHFLLGRAYQLAGRTEEARAELALGRAAPPSWPDPFANELQLRRVGFNVTLDQARALIFSNQAASAVHLLEKLRREQPGDVSVINNLADAYSGAGRPQDARALLESALAEHPENCLVRVNLAVLRYREGNVAAALEELERTLAIDPEFAMALDLKGTYLFAQKRYPEALDAFQAELALDERKVEVRLWIGEILLALRRPAEAVEVFEEATRREPGRPEAWRGLGRALKATGDSGRAAEALDRASRLDAKEKP